jgi:hypothetical protein
VKRKIKIMQATRPGTLSTFSPLLAVRLPDPKYKEKLCNDVRVSDCGNWLCSFVDGLPFVEVPTKLEDVQDRLLLEKIHTLKTMRLADGLGFTLSTYDIISGNYNDKMFI